jgi:hypothetical protein
LATRQKGLSPRSKKDDRRPRWSIIDDENLFEGGTYVCTGNFREDFTHVCQEKNLQYIPPVIVWKKPEQEEAAVAEVSATALATAGAGAGAGGRKTDGGAAERHLLMKKQKTIASNKLQQVLKHQNALPGSKVLLYSFSSRENMNKL